MKVWIKILLLSLMLLQFFKPVKAQEIITLPTRIDTVFLIGNEHTKSNVILREIPFTFPDTLDETDFLLIKNRIQNLYLFNRVELHLSCKQQNTALIISVTESWYIYPVPIFFMNERDWNKFSYGLQFTHYNFRGKNEKISVGGWLGYNPGFFINYFNPWLGEKKRIILGFSLFHNTHSNKIFDFDEKRSGVKFTLGRKITLKLKTQFEFSLTRICLPELYHNFSESGNGTDYVPKVSCQIQYDGRDLYEYPRKGYYGNLEIQRTGFNANQPEFWRFKFDNRIYIPIYKKVSVAARNYSIFNKDKLPIYDRVFLGYQERIRGHYEDVYPAPELYRTFDSPHILLNSLEVRFPIIPIHYFSWDNAPLFSNLYQNLKFGLSGGVFIEGGIAWQTRQQFALTNFNSGYGAGLHFHLPYANILRLDYAWNEKGEGQFIVDVGVVF